ncbi:MAG: helix-turn-helix transcriptional regulator [Candidatus Obscuribacterales bacterium]|jgi:DNA-binding XRE family transcriptional regulator
MIKNDRQYQVTCKNLADFRASLLLLEERGAVDTPKWLYDEQLKTVKGEIARLVKLVEEFENLKVGKVKLPALSSAVQNVPDLLIKYRIAKHLTQRELAQLLGLHEQQIQKYESTNYGAASLDTICRIADVLERHEIQ